MTAEEAIKALKHINLTRVHPFYSWEEMAEVRDTAIEALEKQIPKKPINVQDCYIPETYDYDYSVANCPNCRGAFSFDEYHRPLYCDKCGQKLSFEGLE